MVYVAVAILNFDVATQFLIGIFLGDQAHMMNEQLVFPVFLFAQQQKSISVFLNFTLNQQEGDPKHIKTSFWLDKSG